MTLQPGSDRHGLSTQITEADRLGHGLAIRQQDVGALRLLGCMPVERIEQRCRSDRCRCRRAFGGGPHQGHHCRRRRPADGHEGARNVAYCLRLGENRIRHRTADGPLDAHPELDAAQAVEPEVTLNGRVDSERFNARHPWMQFGRECARH